MKKPKYLFKRVDITINKNIDTFELWGITFGIPRNWHIEVYVVRGVSFLKWLKGLV